MTKPRLRHRLEFALVRVAQGMSRLLGRRFSDRLGAALGRFVRWPLGIRTDVVEDQLRHAFPDRTPAWRESVARSAYAHLGREALAILRLTRLGHDEIRAITEVENLRALEEGLAEGKGAIIVTGHLGNWEVAGSALAVRGIPLDVVVQRQANPLVDRLVQETRERLGMRVVYRGGATSGVLDSLAEGRAVALVADQDARERGVFVPFFGRPASTHRGPAILALRSGAPLYVGTALRRPDGGYRAELERIQVPGEEAGSFGDRVAALTAVTTRALEALVRRAPEQYFWFHRRWKTTPERDRGSGGYNVGETSE